VHSDEGIDHICIALHGYNIPLWLFKGNCVNKHNQNLEKSFRKMDSIEWSVYLARGVDYVPSAEIIYHMCNKEALDIQFSTEGALYYPPTYTQDGFIHATADPNFLLGVGNHFYKDDRGDWVCLKLDPNMLNRIGSKIVYEAGSYLIHFLIYFISLLIFRHLNF
jgi:uncharacterized protein (DUF952 family)